MPHAKEHPLAGRRVVPHFAGQDGSTVYVVDWLDRMPELAILLSSDTSVGMAYRARTRGQDLHDAGIVVAGDGRGLPRPPRRAAGLRPRAGGGDLVSGAVEILTAARAMLAERVRWTQGEMARDAYGSPIDAEADGAVCFCAWGAFTRASLGWEDTPAERQADNAMYAAAVALFQYYPSQVNDQLGHAAVLRMYDRAIELAEGRPS